MKFLSLSNLTTYNVQNDDYIQVNIGHYYQLMMAIENLYNYMKIEDKDIVRMEYKDIPTYKGEKLIFPINIPIADKRDSLLELSEDIIPVFIGLTISDYNWKFTEERVAYLKKYEPIGCRDYHTFQKLKSFDIEVYLSGCITLTMPRRPLESENYNTVFFVDAPKSVLEYIPEYLKKDIKYTDHVLYLTKEQFLSDYCVEYTKEIYDLYRDTAKLVITGRYHCALPCIAMGIPVILVKEYMGYPFDLTPKFLPFYTQKNYDEIDWDPQPIDLEEYKNVALECAAKRVWDTYNKYHYYNLHDEYSYLYKNGYEKYEMSLEPFKKEMEKRYSRLDTFEYALWGISSVAKNIFEYMEMEYPNAKLVKVIDAYREEKFNGLLAEKPDVLTSNDSFFTIVTTINCSNHARILFDEIKKNPCSYIYASDPGFKN